jgi:hypothetical protein
MPKDWAYENAEALSFITAPPNNAELAQFIIGGGHF